MDELRYYVCSVVDEPRKTEQTAVQRDKERLARKLKRRLPIRDDIRNC